MESRILNKGDVVLLAYGGHGFEMIEDSEIIEVKQGPYLDEVDKIRFDPVKKNKLPLSVLDSPLAKKDNCYRKAKAKYRVFPSAYASGYIAKCRKRGGNIK